MTTALLRRRAGTAPDAFTASDLQDCEERGTQGRAALLASMRSVAPVRRPVFETPSMRRSGFGIRGWLEAAAAYGVHSDTLLRDAHLEADDLGEDALVTSRQELAVVDRLVATLPEVHGLGVAAGSSCTVGALGPFALACVSADTVEAALEIATSLLDLTFAFVSPVSWRDDRGQLTWLDDRLVPAAIRRQIMERDLTAFLKIVDAITDHKDGIRVHTDLGVDSIADLRAVANGILVIPGSTNAIEIDPVVLGFTTRQANPDAAALWTRHAKTDLAQRTPRNSITSRIGAEVKQRLVDPPSLAELAGSLYMDERTLRRRLAKEGTSYRRIVDHIRHESAVELISYGNESVERVAAHLGYTDAAAFSAAFKRWRGESPGSFRRRQMARLKL